MEWHSSLLLTKAVVSQPCASTDRTRLRKSENLPPRGKRCSRRCHNTALRFAPHNSAYSGTSLYRTVFVRCKLNPFADRSVVTLLVNGGKNKHLPLRFFTVPCVAMPTVFDVRTLFSVLSGLSNTRRALSTFWSRAFPNHGASTCGIAPLPFFTCSFSLREKSHRIYASHGVCC